MGALHSIYGSILYLFPRKSEILAENHTPPLHFTRPLGESLLEYCYTVWYGKIRMVWLPDREKSLIIRSAASLEYRHVTDRQTSCNSTVWAMHSIAQEKRK